GFLLPPARGSGRLLLAGPGDGPREFAQPALRLQRRGHRCRRGGVRGDRGTVLPGELKVQLRVTSYELRVASYELRVESGRSDCVPHSCTGFHRRSPFFNGSSPLVTHNS